MAVDSKHLVNAGVALAIIGFAAWATSVLLTAPTPSASTVEIRPLSFSVENPDHASPADSAK
jgi:hypothetical protein